jgi:hypothetical protein
MLDDIGNDDRIGAELGAMLLDRVFTHLGRFVAYPSEEERVAHTLWIFHTHLIDAFETSPRLAFLSAEPASGKSRALEITEPLVPRAVEAINVSPAYLFRKIGREDEPPTLLYDEIDTVFGPKAKENEELRGLLNAGHRRGAKAGRCVIRGKEVVTEELNAFCPVALAGLGWLPDTILSRSIVIRMRRRAPNEIVEPYRRREQDFSARALGDEIAQWAQSILPGLRGAWPQLPPTIQDRDADVWEPLLAIAEMAGPVWTGKARFAAAILVGRSKEQTPSLGIRLLDDLRTIFGTAATKSTEEILTGLIALEESPWRDMRGKPLSAEGLAKRLRQYEVRSVRISERPTVRGYALNDLKPVFARYLHAQPDKPDAHDALNATHPANERNSTSKPHFNGDKPSAPSAPGLSGATRERTEALEERAAILEFDCGLSREDAERQAAIEFSGAAV